MKKTGLGVAPAWHWYFDRSVPEMVDKIELNDDGLWDMRVSLKGGETLEYLLDYNPENIEGSEIIPPITDITPPEAKIHFNTNEGKIEIVGIDDITENPQVNEEKNCTKEKKGKCLNKEYIYTITDNAGNTLKLWMEKIIHKSNILVRIKKIQYNEEEQIQTKASLHYVWKRNQDNAIKFLSQVLKDSQNFVLNANYHLSKDGTKISGYDWTNDQGRLIWFNSH